MERMINEDIIAFTVVLTEKIHKVLLDHARHLFSVQPNKRFGVMDGPATEYYNHVKEDTSE